MLLSEGGDPVTFCIRFRPLDESTSTSKTLDPRLKHAGMTVAGAAALGAATGNHHFSASDDWSTVTPGPMVELSETFCR